MSIREVRINRVYFASRRTWASSLAQIVLFPLTSLGKRPVSLNLGAIGPFSGVG